MTSGNEARVVSTASTELTMTSLLFVTTQAHWGRATWHHCHPQALDAPCYTSTFRLYCPRLLVRAAECACRVRRRHRWRCRRHNNIAVGGHKRRLHHNEPPSAESTTRKQSKPESCCDGAVEPPLACCVKVGTCPCRGHVRAAAMCECGGSQQAVPVQSIKRATSRFMTACELVQYRSCFRDTA
jgi:hypothetical protein